VAAIRCGPVSNGRSKRTHCGEAAAKALARTHQKEQDENTHEAVKEALSFSNKAPSSFLYSIHRAIASMNHHALAAALDWLFHARVLERH
jgi:hypothetical protein